MDNKKKWGKFETVRRILEKKSRPPPNQTGKELEHFFIFAIFSQNSDFFYTFTSLFQYIENLRCLKKTELGKFFRRQLWNRIPSSG